MHMKTWIKETLESDIKKPMPILSYPAVQLMGIGVNELITDSETIAEGMRLIAARTDAAAACGMMDLSVEAEAFGSPVRFSADETPVVTAAIVNTKEDAENLNVPGTGSGRIALYIDSIRKAAQTITDRPVFAGVIGPLTLAGRLIGVTETMLACYEDTALVHATLEKATEFIAAYAKAYKQTGASGVIIAEPLAGILSPAMCEEFSMPYVKRIIDAVQDDEFIAVYHNCGNSAVDILGSILKCGAAVYHFGNAVSMEKVLSLVPSGIIVMGNIDPAGEFKNGTPETIRKATLDLLNACSSYPNFIISSGCDIPPSSGWDNIDAFFATVKEFYAK